MRRWGEKNKAHLIIGPRQAGKSTTIWNWLHHLGKPVLFIDCEQKLVQDWCNSASFFVQDLESSFNSIPILFFEEVQHLKNAGLFIKGIVDRKLKTNILVTGSSAYHIRASTRESLAGRATRTRLLPFSWKEVCRDIKDDNPMAHELKIKKSIERHIIYGGYPEVWLSEHPETVLTDLLESFVLRDASDFSNIHRPDAFRTLLSLAAHQAGSLVNVSEWAQILKVDRQTVYSYLEILESAHILETVRPFTGGKRSELTRTPKIYWLDSGLRNRVLADFRTLETRQDKGPLLENWVFTEIRKALPALARLHFWRSTSGAEVDFVVVQEDRLLAVEVKAGQNPRRIIKRSLHSFTKAYRPYATCIVTGYSHSDEGYSEDKVSWVPAQNLAHWLQAHLK